MPSQSSLTATQSTTDAHSQEPNGSLPLKMAYKTTGPITNRISLLATSLLRTSTLAY